MMKHRLRLPLMALLALGIAGLRSSHPVHAATTFTVTTCSSDSQLQADVATANTDNAGDTINFSCGGTIDLTGTLAITGSMTIDGSGQTVVLDGQNTLELMTVATGVTLDLEDLTLENGNAGANSGGALYSDGAVTITNSVLSGNSATNGGAVYEDAGTVSIFNSTFSSNSSTSAPDSDGGAIYIHGGTMTSFNTSFLRNSAANDGGAIYNDFNLGTVSLTDSTFSGNSVGAYGGAIENQGLGTVTITACTMSSNSSIEGAAINNNGDTVTVTDSTFNSNSVTGDGGAIANGGTTVSINNSTFSGNSAGGYGGAIYNYGDTVNITNSTLSGNTATDGGGAIIDDNTPLTIGGSIVAGNTGGNCITFFGGTITDQGYNLEDGTDCGFTGTGSLQNTNPSLGSLSNNGGLTDTMALAAVSPAIDAIPTSYDIPSTSTLLCPATDQRGYGRPDDSETSCDIGAYESGGAPTVARVASFGVVQVHAVSGSRLEFRWRLSQTAGVVGFNLFAGTHRLNARTIPVHAAATYRYAVHWTGHGPYWLKTLLANGGSLSFSTP